MTSTCNTIKCTDIIVLLGKPGSGRSTVGTHLAERLGCNYLSLGAHIRGLQRHGGTSFARRLSEADAAGELKPWWVVSHLIGDAVFDLRDEDCLVMDGVGRTTETVALFHEAVQWIGRTYRVFEIDASDELAMRRMTAVRPNDPSANMSETVAHRRLAAYAAEATGREALRKLASVHLIKAENSAEETVNEIMKDLSLS